MKTALDSPHLPWRRIATSGMLSVLTHAMILLLAGLSLRGCQKTGPGQAGGEIYRQVGLFVVDGLEDSSGEVGLEQSTETVDSQEQTPTAAQQQNNLLADRVDRVPQQIPRTNSLIQPFDSNASGTQESPFAGLIGPGAAIAGLGEAGGGTGELIRAGDSGAAQRTGGIGGEGDTSFMDIAAKGKNFVYLIDTSSSMDGVRLRVAQQQLKASLRMLKPEHQFAVIFYNEYRTRMKLRRKAERPMYHATPTNRILAEQEVDRVTPDAGTDHKPALMEALSLEPDVIYFLTDGDEPRLSAADLRDVRHLAGSTSIHVIQLSNGAYTSRSTNWLEQLAQQCQGEYRLLTVRGR